MIEFTGWTVDYMINGVPYMTLRAVFDGIPKLTTARNEAMRKAMREAGKK